MKRFLASGFGVGLFWKTYFGDKKGGGTLASFLFALITYVFNLNVLELSILFIVLVLTYLVSVDDIPNDEITYLSLSSNLTYRLIGFVNNSNSDLALHVNGSMIGEKYTFHEHREYTIPKTNGT